MAKKLSDIEDTIHDQTRAFHYYLNETLPIGVLNFIAKLQEYTNVYLFSGIIRNFFIESYSKERYHPRDIDLIIEKEIDIKLLFPSINISQNSFGGYKTKIDGLSVDFWVISKTWGLNRGQLQLPFNHLEYLPKTTFFNFSSILYSFEEKRFIIGKPFLKFIQNGKLDIVMEENPYPALCIVNCFYYTDKFNLELSERLKMYLKEKSQHSIQEFEPIQLKHFGKILFSKANLINRISQL